MIISKTFIGLRAQEAIIQKVAEELGLKYRLAKPDEEAKGIDGIIGRTPVSVKPSSYKSQVRQKDTLPHALIFYDNDENSKLIVEFDEKRIS